jgi:lipopolysaccharide/colanic/teichoic acid biosynthesis glycosyltransferase
MKRWFTFAMPAGIFGIVVGLGVVHAALAENPYTYGGNRLWWGLVYAAILWVGAYSFGLPDVPRVLRQSLAAAFGAALVGTFGLAVAQAGLGAQVLPRFVLVAGGILTVPWLIGISSVWRGANSRVQAGDRVLVVAESEGAAQLIAELESVAHPPLLVAVVDPAGGRSQPNDQAPLVRAADDADATVVVLDRQAQLDQSIVDQVALLHERGVRVRTLSLFYEQWLLRLSVSELERVSLMFDIGEIHRARYSRRKRILDVLVASAGLPAFALAVPLVWLGNLVANQGSLFFRQERVGKNGAPFQILKFRTMTGADTGAGTWTSGDDSRVTTFGSFLRRSHIDELPQVLNILRGELSIVGPRPEQPHYVRELSSKLPFYDLRHLVQPGLTGWAQIHQGYAASESDALEKLQYEFWYLRHQSLAMDLRITVRTLRSVVGGRGR